jgi:hypothetical protein
MIPLNLNAGLRIEYGDDNFFPSTYHVRSVMRGETDTRVLLEPPAATCKARERQDCSVEACCA